MIFREKRNGSSSNAASYPNSFWAQPLSLSSPMDPGYEDSAEDHDPRPPSLPTKKEINTTEVVFLQLFPTGEGDLLMGLRYHGRG